MVTTRLPIVGMTCRSCELRVRRALERVDGVGRATVSVRTSTATIESERRVRADRLAAAVEGAGYAVGAASRPWLSRDRTVWRDVGLAVLTVTGLAVLAGRLDVAGLPGSDGPIDAGGALLAVALGVIAGFSTCMALVGGLVLAVSARYAERHPQGSLRHRMRPQLAFQFGRVLGFTLLGALLGLLGSTVTLGGGPVAVLMILVAVVMGLLGLQLTRVSPRLTGGLTLPPRLTARLGLDRTDGRYVDARAALLGVGTFLLPCGFTQAVQVYALSTGDPVQAGLIMGGFALGTMPGLLAIGGLTASARGPVGEKVLRFAGVVVLAFAMLNLSGAVTTLAPGLTWPGGGSDRPTTISANVSLEDGVQVLRTEQGLEGYSPADATVRVGRPVRWEINSVSMGCASLLDAAELGLPRTTLRFGHNTLGFTPTRPGTYHYACAMGMFRGTVTVIA